MIFRPRNSAKTNSRLWWLGLTLIMALAVGVTAQTQGNESETAPVTGTITGRVITEAGQPLANASVVLRGSVSRFQPRITFTDSGGNFTVTGLDHVLYGVSASAPAYVLPPRDPDSMPTYYRVGDAVTLTLIKGGVISGAVLSATGEPFVRITVRAVLVRDANRQPPRYTYQLQRPTDDRGIYRIYGLVPGTYVVSAGGHNVFGPGGNAYNGDAPTYAPSSTRDTASEVSVRAGEEINGVDIRYRGEPGHVVSGFISGLMDPNAASASNITLQQISNGVPMSSAFTYQPPGSKGFAFYGVADGDYDLLAQSSSGGEMIVSEPRRITVKGADITGIELVVRPLGSISGQVALVTSDAIECKNKRRPSFAETLVMARRSEKVIPKDQPRLLSYFFAQGSPNQAGDFELRNLAPGQYNLNARFFAKYWYLRSISREAAVAPSATRGGKGQTDASRMGINLKFGERLRNLTLTLAEGAASLRGALKLARDEAVPPKLYVHLVPAEKENAEDVLRFFASEVHSDGTFALNNLPPGRYWALTRIAAANESQLETKIRAPEGIEMRAQIRRTAEAAKMPLEFKPCQNVIDYQLPLALTSLKN